MLMQNDDAMTIDAAAKAHAPLSDRDRLVIEIAKQTAIGMRKSASAHNIRRVHDFVDALTFAGLLVQKNMMPDASGDPVFIDTMHESAPHFLDVLAGGHLLDAEASLADMKGEIGLVDRSPSEMLVTLGLTAEGILMDLAASYSLSKQETMKVLTFAIVFALKANTPAEELADEVEAVLAASTEKLSHWDAFIPSDDEMFGDLLEEDDDD